ncbi:hypothetical protein [Nocardia cyriacigeorgica]|uniref:hypothetical protein n=1 Tax=Nocardia cyriacigeorgica TaxID=135487 RepID=UPI00189379CD|nr:hypothetical protein [Nocardia cyriacigeorgica]MBF6416946.1 hypothetical protein [Nocardia cyriacigeorgica]
MTMDKLAQLAWPWVVAAAVFIVAAAVVRFTPDWLVDALAIAFLASWVLDALGLSLRLGLRRCCTDECAGQHVSR